MQSHEFFTPIKRELQIMEEELIKAVDTNQPLLKQASGHLIHAGGKRLRPAFVLLTGSCFTSKIDHLIPMAVAMELVHMATLVHDDVIDNSMSRRGRDTVKARFGNRMSIYSGIICWPKPCTRLRVLPGRPDEDRDRNQRQSLPGK